MDERARTDEPSAAMTLAFGTVVLALFAATAIVVALFVAHPKSTVATAAPSSDTATNATTTAPLDASAATTLAVNLKEFSITSSVDTIPPGVKTLAITNSGSTQHELLVFHSDLDPSAYPIDAATGDINEDGAGISKISDGDNLDPGSSTTRAIDLSQPGTYSFVCNLPGHFRQGMVKELVVAPTLPSAALTLTDFKVGTGSEHFTPGSYDFSIANGGPSQHELLVFRTTLAPQDLPKQSDGSVQENGSGVDKISDGDNIDPGKIQDRVVDLSQPGTYVFLCNLPGHYANGMYAVVNVS
jgi:uncharacterized cupredoxin-like copper-binding protein